MSKLDLSNFIAQHMRQGGRYVSGRVQAAMALLEKIREDHALDPCR